MTDFFSRSKELKEKAIKPPYKKKWDGSSLLTEKGENFVSFDCTEYTGEYIVHCVNTHAKLCELLERALKQLDGADSYNQMCMREIQAELEKLK